MRYAKPLVGTVLLIALMLVASAWAWGRLGDAPVAVHFGLDGRPNGFAPKGQALLAMPVVALILAVFYTVVPPLMPARSRLERSWGPYVTVWLATLLLLLTTHLALIAFALGMAIDISRIIAVGVGGLIAVIGNLLGKVRYNFVFGFRTPWTLSNELVWDRTHRFAGRAMAVAGLLLAAAGVLTPAGAEPLLPVAVMLAALTPTVLGVIYSIMESRRVERGSAG